MLILLDARPWATAVLPVIRQSDQPMTFSGRSGPVGSHYKYL